MAEFKLFGTPQFHDAAWYQSREAADHINDPSHRIRLLEALRLIHHIIEREDLELKTLTDWGAGNGGLLSEFKKNDHGMKYWGYDLCPANVEYGIEKYGVDVKLVDIVEGDPVIGEITVLTELLEHLVSPHDLLERLLHPMNTDEGVAECRWIVASTPGFEDFQHHYIYHLYAWTGDSFAQMFSRVGWYVTRHFTRAEAGTQFVVACHPDIL